MRNNYDKELDFILGELIRAYEVENKGISFIAEEATSNTKDHITRRLMEQFGLQEWQINVLYYTLLIDEHVKTLEPLTISIEGMVFINNGGYVEKTLRKTTEANRIDKIQQDIKNYSYGLMIFTAIVALGTIISAWFFAIEIYRYYLGTWEK